MEKKKDDPMVKIFDDESPPSVEPEKMGMPKFTASKPMKKAFMMDSIDEGDEMEIPLEISPSLNKSPTYSDNALAKSPSISPKRKPAKSKVPGLDLGKLEEGKGKISLSQSMVFSDKMMSNLNKKMPETEPQRDKLKLVTEAKRKANDEFKKQ